MPQIRQDHCFPAELARILFCGEQVLLNRDIHCQILVYGAVNGSHPALTENLENAISTI